MNRKPKTRPATSVLAQRIRDLREEADLKQYELAAMAGVSARTMAALEQGTCWDPQVHTLQKVADALQVSLDYLMGRPAFPIRKPSRPKVVSRDPVTALYGRSA